MACYEKPQCDESFPNDSDWAEYYAWIEQTQQNEQPQQQLTTNDSSLQEEVPTTTTGETK